MYILFTRTPKIQSVIAGLLLCINLTVSGQYYPLRIDITVVPPYTSNLNNYINTPNKIIANISYSSMDFNDVDVYLKGTITSDNGIVIRTKDSYKPAYPLHLTRGMVYTLTPNDLSGMFDMNQLESSGINMKDLYSGAGLPEDNYQLCVRVYDYNTGRPLSNEEPLGCSNYFMVTNFEPPLITTPFCGDSINISPIQSAMISWTTPAGAIGAQYKFELIEIPEGIDVNPNDAFQSSFQTIFEEILSVNIINLTSDKVLLTPGYTYAFRVQATDPMGNHFFRNSGYSEVCYFVCKGENTTDDLQDYSSSESLSNNLNQLKEQFELIPNTIISGRLMAKFPDSPHDENILIDTPGSQGQIVIPPNGQQEQILIDPDMMNKQVTLPTDKQNNKETAKGVSYNQVSMVGKNVQEDVNSNSSSSGGTFVVSENAIFSGLTEISRKPYYKYGNAEEIVNVKAFANMEVRLVARWAFLTNNTPFNSGFPEYRDRAMTELFTFTDLDGNETDPTRFANVVLATTTTDESGNFSFNFSSDFVTGNANITDLGDPVEQVDQQDPESQILEDIEAVFTGSVDQVVVNPAMEAMFTTGQDLLGDNTAASGGQQLMSHVFEGGSEYTAYFCLKIEVVNPKFCSPDIDIFAMPGDVLEVPTQVAKLKTYNLKVVTYAPDKKHQTAVANEPMDNVRVSIMRDEQNLDNENELILDYEGQRLKTKTMNNNGNFKNVAIDTSGAGIYAYTYFKNLVKHANVSPNSSTASSSFSMPPVLQFTSTAPQYFIEISTRNDSEKEDEYEFTRYNYAAIFKELETTNLNNANWHSLQYNHEYEIPEVEFDYTLEACRPEIKGRVMTKTNYQVTSIKDVRVELYEQSDSTKTFSYPYQLITSGALQKDTKYTNNVGIFRFEDLYMDENTVGDIMGPFRRIYISHPGYKSVTRPIPGMKPWNLSWGMLKDIKDVYLEPSDSIKGVIEDEEGNPVSSYVKSESSPFYSTYDFHFLGKTHQFFEVPSIHHGTRIIVHPKSSQYFSRDTIIGVKPNGRVKIVVYKKLHRPKIIVTNKSGIPIQGAVVELGEQTPDTTDTKGVAKFKFASPGDQFIVKIIPPQEYAPMQEPIKIPVTPGDTIITYKLEYANRIKGTITEKDSNTPIPDALIYSELENTDGTILYIETRSNQNGEYVLGGIPKNLTTLKVHAVKQGKNPSYVGTSKNITFSQSVTMMPVIPTHNFELKRADDWDLSNIWNYPVVVEVLAPSKAKPDEYVISGYFLDPPLVDGFTLQQPDVKFNFNYIAVNKSANGKIEPVKDEIELDANKIPLFINGTFAGTLYNHKKTYAGTGNSYVHNTFGQHKIVKESNEATLKGIFQINLETFQSAYSFNGELYIGNPSLGNKVKVFSKNQSQIISVATPMLISPRYNIFSLNNLSFQPVPIKDYEVFKFPATSDMDNTYLQGDKIYIRTILNTDIPTCNTCSNLNLELPVGDIVVTKSNIRLVETPNDSLYFPLENWKVYNKGSWYFDKNEEAIVLEKALIVTGKSINASVKDLKIWPTAIGEGTIDMSNGGLSLGGIAQIKLNGNLTPIFNYDPIGHYRISVVGSLEQDIPAGTVTGLPEMNDDLEFEAIGMLSNGTDILTINKTFRFYDILDIEVTQIVSGNGYFDLQGNPILGVPGLVPEETAMRYMKDAQGEIVPELQPIKGGVDAPGYVYFSLDHERASHKIKKHEYKGYGTLYISPGTDPSDSRTYKLRGELIKTNNQCKIEVFKVDQNKKYRGAIPQNMIVGNNTILVTDGYLNTSNNTWDSLVYFGNTASIEGFKNAQKPENELTFVVKGDVDVSSSNVEVNNIDVGIGKMSMTYDFDEGSMRGFLEVQYLPIGPAYVNQGQMSINFGSYGYYFALGSKSFFLGNAGEFKGGFIFGNSRKIDPVDINFFSSNFKVRLPDFATEGISGMYAIGEKVFINKSIDLVFTKAAIDAGVGIYVNADFSDSYAFTLGGYGHAEVKGSAGFEEAGINICSVDVCVSAFCNVEAKYVHKTKTLSMNNCIVLSAQGSSSGLCNEPLGAIGVDPSLKFSIGANYGYNGEKFYATFKLSGTCGEGDNTFDVSGCN